MYPAGRYALGGRDALPLHRDGFLGQCVDVRLSRDGDAKPEISARTTRRSIAIQMFALRPLIPGYPIKITGAEPITWTWEIINGTDTTTGTGIPITPNPYTFNLGTNYIIWIATNISGSDTCVQTIIVVDNEPPTFDPPGPFVFCVSDIIDAVYNGEPEPDADIDPIRPDWYIIDGTTELDISGLNDNCCPADSITIYGISLSVTAIPRLTAPDSHQPMAHYPLGNY